MVRKPTGISKVSKRGRFFQSKVSTMENRYSKLDQYPEKYTIMFLLTQ